MHLAQVSTAETMRASIITRRTQDAGTFPGEEAITRCTFGKTRIVL